MAVLERLGSMTNVLLYLSPLFCACCFKKKTREKGVARKGNRKENVCRMSQTMQSTSHEVSV
jgi:hypothetical protein